MTNEREIILDTLMEILEKKEYSHLVLRSVLDKYAYLPKRERAFIMRISEGCIENCIYLDYVINQFSKTKTNKMKPLIRTLLRMGTYQILFMDAVPDSAAINECVKLSEKRGFRTLKGFVNGVLRNISRNKETLQLPKRETNLLEFLSIKYSMPDWIVKMWLEKYGEETVEDILKSFLKKRPVCIRMRQNIPSAQTEECLLKMKQQGIEVIQSKELKYAYFLDHIDSVRSIPGYEEGIFAMQDIGSMLIVDQAKIHGDAKVIDVCAAPGGKSIHAHDCLSNSGYVLARDLTEEKVAIINENKERCRATNLSAQCFDATIMDESLKDGFDYVIADLPCSGLGVIGRKSDIKYRITPEKIEETALLQQKILSVVSSYVKKGGMLIYSTCTLTNQENEENVKWFLENFPFKLKLERTLIPGKEESDGFYMAYLIRD